MTRTTPVKGHLSQGALGRAGGEPAEAVGKSAGQQQHLCAVQIVVRVAMTICGVSLLGQPQVQTLSPLSLSLQ